MAYLKRTRKPQTENGFLLFIWLCTQQRLILLTFSLRFLFSTQRKKETQTQKGLEKDEGVQREKKRIFSQKGFSSPFAINPSSFSIIS